jgi:hypothetical protein
MRLEKSRDTLAHTDALEQSVAVVQSAIVRRQGFAAHAVDPAAD